ncbi:MAG: hypothetical protein AAF432_05490 [Planctomycetota bacterium]
MKPSTTVDARPAALINGASVNWGDLRDPLCEAAGGLILEELILDQQLRRTLAEDGYFITQADLDRERTVLLGTLNEDPNQAAQLLQELRKRRGLGPERFESMLFRTAALRKIVAPRVRIEPESLDAMYDILYGERRQPRIMTFASLSEARQAIDELNRGEDFPDVAIRRSLDVSAARGGLLEPMSQRDPAFPVAIRNSLWQLGTFEISSPILVGDQYVLLRLDRVIPAQQVSRSSVRQELEDAARQNQERLLMASVARTMLSDASVTVFDPSLASSWSTRQQLANDLLTPSR